ncbi:uncharacterized protein LOC121731344 [Aricia agestis]|uniref:uncharacterized protein LOC121731344 n=1 Tax=Aricia agestis TaxID=91739 RepID=UPI001C203052|nr:uncharacterized protein LOC121731344 [Aricia agestis]
MVSSQYNKLKQQIVLRVGKSDGHSHILKVLKDFYSEDIDSKRRYEQIDTLGKLLRVLEIRDVLSEDNVAPLKEICRRLSDNELLFLINEYENSYKQKLYTSHNAVQSQPAFEKEPAEKPVRHLHESLSPRKLKRLEDTLVQEIGTFWRDLARNLKIRECDIDNIDSNYTSSEEKAREVLELYKTIWDPQKWFYVLCNALEKSRRKDLCKSLQKIIVMDI